ncbi:MAG: HAD family hydrolase [Planctomycetota bacterium]|jgi:phosphoglycolate phosphatase-like HAD superfamily hydrolase
MSAPKQRVSVVITDLDNTLFDWVNVWYSSFRAMLDKTAEISGRPERELIPQIKKIHEKYGTSEYSFLIEEIPALQQLHSGMSSEQIKSHYDDAIHAYNKERKRTLKLFDGVLHGLMELRASGCLLVAYTESMAFYTRYRMINLGLDQIMDILYSPKDHDLPRNLTPDQIRIYDPEKYKLRVTEHRELPAESLKPNARILLDIISDVDADINETIYVGDSKMKDIVMAQRAGVTAVHAEYGVAHRREEYKLLQDVTHWSDYQVEMEQITYEKITQPKYVLSKRFDEILGFFDFVPYRGRKTSIDKDGYANVIELWKKTIDVQQHFNDIELKIRQFALTITATILGLSAISLREPLMVTLWGAKFPVAIPLLVAGFVIWTAFYFMDRHWYHRLLLGAVNHGRNIERRMVRYFPEVELTEAIGKASPMSLPFTTRKLHSTGKMNLFYGLGALGFILLIVSLAFADFPPSVAKPNGAMPQKTSERSADSGAHTSQQSTLSPPRGAGPNHEKY